MQILLAGLSNDTVELNLARALNAAGLQLFVVAVPGSAAVGMCRDTGIPYEEYGFRNRFDRTGIALYRRLLGRASFRVVHCLTNRALSTALLATRSAGSGPAMVAYRGTMGHLSRFDPASHFSYLNKRIDCIICVSDAVRRYLKTFRIPDQRLAVIWKGHDTSWYTAAPREALKPFAIPGDATVVNFTGNIRPVKGVDFLLKAFAGIHPSEKIHLLIVGEVRDAGIKKWIGRYPHIHFAGFRENASALAGACDISVMPSIEREGLPKAALEAMAQGIPAVVSDVGGMPELVEHEKSGLVIPPRDAAAIARAVRLLATDTPVRLQLGRAARQRIEGPFNFRHTMEKTIALYQRVGNR